MTTSGLTNTVPTVRQIIKRSLIKLGEYGAMEEPDAADEQLGVESLNAMLKDWQNDGVNLWRQAEYVLTWPAATASQTLSAITGRPNLLDIEDMRYVQSSTFERPMDRWVLTQYNSLPNKTQAGEPTIFCVTPSQVAGSLGLTVRIWPVPAAVSTINITAARVIEDVTDANETLDVPPQHERTVVECLAEYMDLDFPAGDPVARAKLIASAQRRYRIMRASDRPASYTFEGVRSYG